MLKNSVLRLEELQLPKLGRRVKTTCIHASSGYLALGTNTGSVYIYSANALSLVKLVAPPKGHASVSRIRFCPRNPNLLAIASGGVVSVVECRLSHLQEDTRVIFQMAKHGVTKHIITAMTWDEQGYSLFTGDNGGIVMRSVPVSAKKGSNASSSLSFDLALSSSLFQSQEPQQVCSVDSPVVQLAAEHGLLICSCITRAIVMDVAANKAPVQVGTKLRRGPYGACFDPNSNGRQLFAARPGRRLWVADSHSGQVLSTMKMKLPDVPSQFNPYVEHCDMSHFGAADRERMAKTVMNRTNFLTVHPFQYGVVSWCGGVLLLIDTVHVRVTHWVVDLGLIVDVAVVGQELFVLHTPLSSDTTTAADPTKWLDIPYLQALVPGANLSDVTLRSVRLSRVQVVPASLQAQLLLTQSRLVEACELAVRCEVQDMSVLQRLSSELKAAGPDDAKEDDAAGQDAPGGPKSSAASRSQLLTDLAELIERAERKALLKAKREQQEKERKERERKLQQEKEQRAADKQDAIDQQSKSKGRPSGKTEEKNKQSNGKSSAAAVAAGAAVPASPLVYKTLDSAVPFPEPVHLTPSQTEESVVSTTSVASVKSLKDSATEELQSSARRASAFFKGLNPFASSATTSSSAPDVGKAQEPTAGSSAPTLTPADSSEFSASVVDAPTNGTSASKPSGRSGARRRRKSKIIDIAPPKVKAKGGLVIGVETKAIPEEVEPGSAPAAAAIPLGSGRKAKKNKRRRRQKKLKSGASSRRSKSSSRSAEVGQPVQSPDTAPADAAVGVEEEVVAADDVDAGAEPKDEVVPEVADMDNGDALANDTEALDAGDDDAAALAVAADSVDVDVKVEDAMEDKRDITEERPELADLRELYLAIVRQRRENYGVLPHEQANPLVEAWFAALQKNEAQPQEQVASDDNANGDQSTSSNGFDSLPPVLRSYFPLPKKETVSGDDSTPAHLDASLSGDAKADNEPPQEPQRENEPEAEDVRRWIKHIVSTYLELRLVELRASHLLTASTAVPLQDDASLHVASVSADTPTWTSQRIVEYVRGFQQVLDLPAVFEMLREYRVYGAVKSFFSEFPSDVAYASKAADILQHLEMKSAVTATRLSPSPVQSDSADDSLDEVLDGVKSCDNPALTACVLPYLASPSFASSWPSLAAYCADHLVDVPRWMLRRCLLHELVRHDDSQPGSQELPSWADQLPSWEGLVLAPAEEKTHAKDYAQSIVRCTEQVIGQSWPPQGRAALQAYVLYLAKLLQTHAETRDDEGVVMEFVGFTLLLEQPPLHTLFVSSSSPPPSSSSSSSSSVLPPSSASSSSSSSLSVSSNAPSVLPAPGADRLQWGPHHALLHQVFARPDEFAVNPRRAQMLCRRFGFMPGLLPLLVAAGQIRQALELCVHVDSPDALRGLVADQLHTGVGSARCSSLWRHLLCSVVWQHSLQLQRLSLPSEAPHSDNVPDKNEITVATVVTEMVALLGPGKATGILVECQQHSETTGCRWHGAVLSNAHFPLELYARILNVAELQNAKASVRAKILQTIDSHLWTHTATTAALAPQLRTVLQHEEDAHLQQYFDAMVARLTDKQTLRKVLRSGLGSRNAGNSADMQRNNFRVDINPEDDDKGPGSTLLVEEKDVQLGAAEMRALSGADDVPAALRAIATAETDTSSYSDVHRELSLLVHYDSPLPRGYEEASGTGHWGARVRVADARCTVCSLPVRSEEPMSDPRRSKYSNAPRPTKPCITGSLTVFPCGHIFHTACVPTEVCVQCLGADALPS